MMATLLFVNATSSSLDRYATALMKTVILKSAFMEVALRERMAYSVHVR